MDVDKMEDYSYLVFDTGLKNISIGDTENPDKEIIVLEQLDNECLTLAKNDLVEPKDGSSNPGFGSVELKNQTENGSIVLFKEIEG